MDLKSAITRAQRGFREEIRLYLVAVSSISVAFLCLAAALLAQANLRAVAERWGESSRMTVYLRDGASAEDVAQLQVVLSSLAEVGSVEHLTSEMARAQFLEQSDVGADLASLPVEAFPPSVEVTLRAGTSADRVSAIAARVTQFRGVSDVETYRGWFERLDSLLTAGRGVAGGLAVLVGLCVLAVISNTIRLAVARRREEIEVMKLCGATDGFVRGPFVLEGTFQGFVSAVLAVVVLMIGYFALRSDVDSTIVALTGGHSVFIEPWLLVALVVGGGGIGAAGSALSLRRYLSV